MQVWLMVDGLSGVSASQRLSWPLRGIPGPLGGGPGDIPGSHPLGCKWLLHLSLARSSWYFEH